MVRLWALPVRTVEKLLIFQPTTPQFITKVKPWLVVITGLAFVGVCIACAWFFVELIVTVFAQLSNYSKNTLFSASVICATTATSSGGNLLSSTESTGNGCIPSGWCI